MPLPLVRAAVAEVKLFEQTDIANPDWDDSEEGEWKDECQTETLPAAGGSQASVCTSALTSEHTPCNREFVSAGGTQPHEGHVGADAPGPLQNKEDVEITAAEVEPEQQSFSAPSADESNAGTARGPRVPDDNLSMSPITPPREDKIPMSPITPRNAKEDCYHRWQQVLSETRLFPGQQLQQTRGRSPSISRVRQREGSSEDIAMESVIPRRRRRVRLVRRRRQPGLYSRRRRRSRSCSSILLRHRRCVKFARRSGSRSFSRCGTADAAKRAGTSRAGADLEASCSDDVPHGAAGDRAARMHRALFGAEHSRASAGKQEQEACQVYVGSVPLAATDEDMEVAFTTLFRQLPDYQTRYPDPEFLPVVSAKKPRPSHQNVEATFRFLELADLTLASTAVRMSGLQVLGISVKVHWGRLGTPPGPKDKPLDVSSLRISGKLPFVYYPGVRMITEVWIGGLTLGLSAERGKWLKVELGAVLLGLPAVRAEFPDLTQPVIEVKATANYAFVTLANEVLASTAVAMGQVRLPCGASLTVGWPSGADNPAERAPLPLPFEDIGALPAIGDAASGPSTAPPNPGAGCLALLPDPSDSSAAAQAAMQLAAAAKKRSDTSEADCEVFVGYTLGVEDAAIEQGLACLLKSVPDYYKSYAAEESPVLAIRGGGGPGQYAFARLRDPVLASTAVALGNVWVNGKRLKLSRPTSWKSPAEGPTPPLDVTAGRCPPQAARHAKELPSLPKPRPTPATLWVGNLCHRQSDTRTLDNHLTKLALGHASFDLEEGPPFTEVLLHRCKRYAFVTVRDIRLADQLLPVFDGSVYCGRPLAVNFSARFRPRKILESELLGGAGPVGEAPYRCTGFVKARDCAEDSSSEGEPDIEEL